MQRSELLKTNISLWSVLFGAKSQERGKKQQSIHSSILGVMSLSTGTQSKPVIIYSVSTMCQVLGKVLLRVRLLMKTETILALQILESNKEDQYQSSNYKGKE